MKLQQIEQAAFIKLERELHEAQLRAKVSEGAHEQTALNMHKAKLEVARLEHNAGAQNERVEWMARRMEAHVTELGTLKGQLKVSKDAHEQTACQYMKSRQEAKRLHGELSERDHRLVVFVKDLAERTEELSGARDEIERLKSASAMSNQTISNYRNKRVAEHERLREEVGKGNQAASDYQEELAQSKVQLGVSHMARKKLEGDNTACYQTIGHLKRQRNRLQDDVHALNNRHEAAIKALQGTA